MIKFFRKIRQDLLSKGKTGKYLKYAIGEIILVVIGILIALQINNWNEERKSDNKGKELIRLIYNDLNTDITNLNGVVKRLDEQLNAAENLLVIFESQNKFIEDTLAFSNDWARSSWPLSVERVQNTFSELKTSGQSTLINDKSLIDDLNQFYISYDSRIDNFNDFPKDVRRQRRIINMTSGNLFDSKTWQSKNVATHNYIQEILGNPKTYELTLGIFKTCHYNRNFFNELSVSANNIIKSIEERHPVK